MENSTSQVAVATPQSGIAAQLLDFEKNKVQTLTLDQLRRTHKENDVYGHPLKGIYHYELLENVMEMCEHHGYHAEVYDLFAAQNRDRTAPGVVLLPQVEAQLGARATEAHIIRRVYANIRLTDFDDDTHTTAMAVAFHQRGIQVGFGNMVQICHNLCMLGADKYIATYGNGKNSRDEDGKRATVEIPQVLKTVNDWLTTAEEDILSQRKRIAAMQDLIVDADTMYRIIGLLTAMRVATDTAHKCIRSKDTYPLNQAQIGQFTEAMMLRYHDKGELTVWDIYDTATNLYKASSMDIPMLLPQNRAMVDFLTTQFAI